MSQHKNYFDKYGQDRDRFVQKEIIYYQTSIFSLFSQKFQKDAQKDWENQKKKLAKWWESCSKSCQKIHEVLWFGVAVSPQQTLELEKMVEEAVNLDYQSLQELFSAIQKVFPQQNLQEWFQKIQKNLQDMRRVSEKHTTIISQK